MSAVPSLVGWASCSQDLLAIDFVLLALLARSGGRYWLAMLALAAAVFSKETSLTAIPALVGWDWISGRRPYRLIRNAAQYGCFVVLWAAIHPAARVLLARGLAPGATGYVGLTDPGTWFRFAARYVAVLTNLRLGSFEPTWSGGTTLYLGLVVVGSALALFSLARPPSEQIIESTLQVRPQRLIALGLLLFIPSLLMTSTIINSWGPYYAGFPMLGASLLGAFILERVRLHARIGVIAVYLALGIWARGSNIDSVHITERALRPSSDALKKIEKGFLTLAPHLPHHTDILLSVKVRGMPRVYVQIYVFQPQRIWYRDTTVTVMKPTHVTPTDHPTILAVITSHLDVVFLNPATFEVNSASGQPPDYYSAETALRGLGLGLAASGYPERGTRLLLRIPDPSSQFRSAHLRLAAMLQLSSGKKRMADSLIAVAEPLPRAVVFDDLHVILAEQPPHMIYDDVALYAFGIRSDDAGALRELSGWLSRYGYAEPAHRLATRLLALQPGDPIGLRALAISDSILVERRKWPEELL
jgi:hypothetical protein